MDTVKSCFLQKTIGDCDGEPEGVAVFVGLYLTSAEVCVAAAIAVQQILTCTLLRAETHCYPWDRARDLLATCPTSGESFSASSGPWHLKLVYCCQGRSCCCCRMCLTFSSVNDELDEKFCALAGN
jgi:hypothetical protein